MRNSKTKGFTLIELIVVMAIIGVLAAILVPSMIGYLNDSKYSKANSNAKQVYQSTANWCTKCEVNNHPVANVTSGATVNLTTGGKTNADLHFDASTGDLDNALIVYMGGNKNSGYAFSSVKNSAPVFGQWKGGPNETILGEYPTELSASKPGSWGTQTTT